MFDFTLKYFFKEIKKNISMIGVITGAMLLLSLILSMFYNTTLNPPLKTDDLAAFFMELFRLTVILIFMLICIYVVVYSTNYYNKIHSKILGLLKIFGYTTKEIVLFFYDTNHYNFKYFFYSIYIIKYACYTTLI